LLKIDILKQLLKENRSFLLFLVKFLIFYLSMTGVYSLFLRQYTIESNEVDGITTHVAELTKSVLAFFNQEIALTNHPDQPAIKVLYHQKYIVRIVEGCNAVSVIILFASFIFAFSSTWKKTISFIFLGALLIYVLNCIRIALLIAGIYYFPSSKDLLHDIVFPSVIYGIVFILWLIWIFKFYDVMKNK
jgi:exosortase family protein XrtF